jgi:hypothetical protein
MRLCGLGTVTLSLLTDMQRSPKAYKLSAVTVFLNVYSCTAPGTSGVCVELRFEVKDKRQPE